MNVVFPSNHMATCFDNQEGAVFAWAKSVILAADSRVPDEIFL
jgi:hypothetical protein